MVSGTAGSDHRHDIQIGDRDDAEPGQIPNAERPLQMRRAARLLSVYVSMAI